MHCGTGQPPHLFAIAYHNCLMLPRAVTLPNTRATAVRRARPPIYTYTYMYIYIHIYAHHLLNPRVLVHNVARLTVNGRGQLMHSSLTVLICPDHSRGFAFLKPNTAYGHSRRDARKSSLRPEDLDLGFCQASLLFWKRRWNSKLLRVTHAGRKSFMTLCDMSHRVSYPIANHPIKAGLFV